MTMNVDFEEAKIVATTLKKLRRGDSITDEELQISILLLTRVVELFGQLGERFHLAWKELRKNLDDLISFRDARNKHK